MNELFYRPPGTGKTIAVGSLAKCFNLDLYRIDLSKVVNKYIGETEKNLNELFLDASDSNMILFFDEADALFGKRNKVKGDNIRNAVVETTFLIHRLKYR